MNIFFNNKNNHFPGLPKRCFGCNGNTAWYPLMVVPEMLYGLRTLLQMYFCITLVPVDRCA